MHFPEKGAMTLVYPGRASRRGDLSGRWHTHPAPLSLEGRGKCLACVPLLA